MSYYISKTARTKEEARAAVLHDFLTVTIAGQPIHERDRAAVVANMDAALSLMQPPSDAYDVCITVNGSLSWYGDADPATARLLGVSVACSVGCVLRAQ